MTQIGDKMKRLFIAEKPEVGRAIAAVLGQTGTGAGCIYCGQDVVTWAVGHLLELCNPEDYDEAQKKWNLDGLPLIHIPWKLKPIDNRGKQLQVVKKLIDQAETIVHAGDTDGEGQLLIDEIFTYFKIDRPVRRVLINDNNPRMVKRAIENMRDNKEFYGLSQSALARSVGDHVYGINLTRLYTLKAQEQGAQGVFSVGRVQTPILGLIVRRDREISGHVKRYYYTIKGEFAADNGRFTGTYVPTGSDPVDDQKRIASEDFAKQIANACSNKPGSITGSDTKDKSEAPPLPYDLLELQSDASRKFGIRPDVTLKLTQALREKMLITYNRSDCRYLNDEQHADAPLVIEAIKSNAGVLAGACSKADASVKGRCFNSANVSAHHAIIPTEAKADLSKLSDNERSLYLLIARQYIAQFYPNKESKVTVVFVDCEGHAFKATSTQPVSAGWSDLYKNDKADDDEESLNDADSGDLSVHEAGDAATCEKVNIAMKETQPPKHYTDATLLQDLRRVAKYIDDPNIAALLKDKDKDKKGEQGGIGTPATRDSFIVKLIDRGFVERKGKKLLSTAVGQSFHDTLPAIATRPDMTALWHAQQKDIEAGKLDTMTFVKGIAKTVTEHVKEVRSSALNVKVSSHECPTCQSGQLSSRPGKFGKFWGCSNYPECKATFKDKSGKPDLALKKQPEPTEYKCGACGKPLIRRLSEKGKGKRKNSTAWYGCSGFPSCKQTYFESLGKPKYS